MGSSNDSAADCNTSGNDTASAPAASGDTAEDFTYSYSAVQKEGVQADASPFDTYDAEDGADDRSADASGGYAIITLDVPAAAEFLHERGMAVYAETDEYVSYLVVAEAAHDLADAMELPEAERTALRAGRRYSDRRGRQDRTGGRRACGKHPRRRRGERMNDIGVIGGADGTTQIVVSGSIGGPILWIFFGALALMVILYAAFYRRGKGKAVCLALAAVFCVAADQAVKFLVVNTMSLGESEPLLPPLLQLTRVHNYGAAWSSFSGARWLLIALTAAGMCAIAWLLVKIVRHPLGQWSLAIILGGGIGNLIDRVRLGYVVDMLDTMFMDFPVFNVADVFVVCGTVCALIYYLAFYSKSDEKNWGNKVDGTDPAANK